jgi:hypothetical protein
MERAGVRLAWPLAIISVTLTAVGLLLLGLTVDRPAPTLWGFRGFTAILGIETAALGGLLMSRRPGNVIGWLFAFVGVTNGIQLVASEYMVAAGGGALPGIEWANWVRAYIWIPTIVVMVGLVPLVFPDGRLLSPRWRIVVWAMIISGVVAMTALAAQPNPGTGGSDVPYPFTAPFDQRFIDLVWTIAYPTVAICIVAAIGSVWLRWRRAAGVEREQLKWLAWAGGLVVITIPLSVLPFVAAQAAFILAIALVPLAIGIAILRYRLYDIDTVIARTLVYGLLTAVLAGLFAGLQRLLQGVFVSVTGNESDAAWAITALVLAASFSPLKASLERIVSRRLGDERRQATPTGAPSEAPRTTGPDDPDEALEDAIRRIVREELAAALAVRPVGATGTREDPAS